MKKITQTLVVAILFLGLGFAEASENKVFNDVLRKNYPPVRYNNADPIVFTERGVEFFVFLDGQFDFNTVRTTAPRSPRRGQINGTYGAPGTYYGPSQGVKIEHDNFGRVRRIGNVFINYDARGRVKRVGSVYMGYNAYALDQVGGLKIMYDRRGRIVGMQGVVNGFNNSNNHYQADGYGGNYYNDTSNDHYENDDTETYNNDEDYYYYRQDGTKVKVEDKKEIKIKK